MALEGRETQYLTKEWCNAMTSLGQSLFHELNGSLSPVEAGPCLHFTRPVQLSILLKERLLYSKEGPLVYPQPLILSFTLKELKDTNQSLAFNPG